MAAVDAALAERVLRWGALSVKKTEESIDALVEEHDPGAVRRASQAVMNETVAFGSPTDVPGTTTIWARLNSVDAALMEPRVEEIAHACVTPTRAPSTTPRQCPGRRGQLHRIRLHVRTTRLPRRHHRRRPGQERRRLRGGRREIRRRRGDRPDSDAASAPSRRAPRRSRPMCSAPESCRPHCWAASWSGHASARSATPAPTLSPEPRYTPSQALCEFVRCRDLTCRFPGCDKPAQVCDLDHTVAYPVGPTHPSNLKCLCRFHHLLKTFWNGLGAGWTDNYPTGPSSGPAQPATPMSPTPAACTCSRACVNQPPPCGPANHPTSTRPPTAV